MSQEKAMEPREIGSRNRGEEDRARIARRLLAVALVVVTSAGLLSMSGCRDRSDVDEAVEEMKDEIQDSKEEIQDEIDDHT